MAVIIGVAYPFTAPIVRPEMKYFWKKGYEQAIGMTPTMNMAMRIVSLGTFSASHGPRNGWSRVEKSILHPIIKVYHNTHGL